MIRRAALLMVVALGLVGCGTVSVEHATESRAPRTSATSATTAATATAATGATTQFRPQAVEPSAGSERALKASAGSAASGTPIGDPNAHAPPLSEVRKLLARELVFARKSNATYINPLRYVSVWGRTDQGVDATMPVGAPILAPCAVKILATIPGWYAGQPLVYFELLEGPDARRIQYVAEQITDIAPPGSRLQQGQVIARYAAHGTAIEYGWSTINGVTLAMATTGYEEGQVTPAGRSIRAWLNSLGAHAGSG